MRKQVYVFDECISSQKNGIGSFLREFHYCMKQLNTDVCILAFNANIKEFAVQRGKYGEIERLLFPPFCVGEFTHNAEIIIKFLRLYIRDSSDNLFFVNHSPCEKLVEIMKRNYPLSRLVFTIHDLGWTSICMGDVDKYKLIIEKKKDIEKNIKSVLDFYGKHMSW